MQKYQLLMLMVDIDKKIISLQSICKNAYRGDDVPSFVILS